MIRINKEEAEELRRRFHRDCHIVRFCKAKSKRHHYCAEETPKVLKVLSELRGSDVRTTN